MEDKTSKRPKLEDPRPWADLPQADSFYKYFGMQHTYDTDPMITKEHVLLAMDTMMYQEQLNRRMSRNKSDGRFLLSLAERDSISSQHDDLALSYIQSITKKLQSTCNIDIPRQKGLIKMAGELTSAKVSKYLPVNPKGLSMPLTVPPSSVSAPYQLITAPTSMKKDSVIVERTPKSLLATKEVTSSKSSTNGVNCYVTSTSTPVNSYVTTRKPVKEDSSVPKKKQRNVLYGRQDDKQDGKEDDLMDELESDSIRPVPSSFQTAYTKLEEDNAKNGKPSLPPPSNDKKRGRESLFGPPMTVLEDGSDDEVAIVSPPSKQSKTSAMSHPTSSSNGKVTKAPPSTVTASTNLSSKLVSISNNNTNTSGGNTKQAEPEFKGVDPDIAERVLNEILEENLNVKWTDIAGLDDVKQILHEMIILPNQHPEMFKGLRAPPRGLLLFGPPGNGKTMIAKAIATEAGLTFFSISASVLCSKWIGDGEKTMRALFAIARAKAPSFIFIDEVDSILCSRSSEEHESSRRLKNEFLLQFDGATTSSEDAVTVMGATNRPFDLDDAARRRLPKRIYVPLPEKATRLNLLQNLLRGEPHSLGPSDIDSIAEKLTGYSCSDIQQISQHAAMGPVRDKMRAGSMTGDLRPITSNDFLRAIDTTRPSVAPEECKLYEDFSQKFGTRGL